jgi:hypothetical protein
VTYPEGLADWALCAMEGCVSLPRCSRCGKTNYHYLSYLAWVARERKAGRPIPDTAATS